MADIIEPTDKFESGGQLADCDICGFTYRKNQLAEKDGKMICPQDYPKQLTQKDYRRFSHVNEA